MGKKIVWILVSVAMVLSLVAAACNAPAELQNPATSSQTSQPASASTSASSPSVSPIVQPAQNEPSVPPVKEPVYGGTYTRAGASDPTGGWDPTINQAIRVSHMQLTSNELMQGDWTKGPQGTGETSWQYGYLGDVSLETGELAESWELKSDGTIIFNIRHGVRFQNKARLTAVRLPLKMWLGT